MRGAAYSRALDSHFAAFDKELARIELRNPPFPVSVYRMRDTMMIEVRVPHRDTGERSTVCHPFSIPDPERFYMPFVEWVFDRLRRVFDHELRELFIVDGVRVHDPHADEVTR